MNTRKLGRSNIEVSALGLGCWAIGGENYRDGQPCGWAGSDDTESLKALEAGFDLGINLIDTAAVYGSGHSEKLVARAIKGKRDKLVIATKFGFPIDEGARTTTGMQWDEAFIRQECENSLRRLDIEVIDLYQFHLGKNDEGEAVREVLEKLVGEGKIRYYGWSTDSTERAAIFEKGEHCTAIQQRLNVFEGNHGTLKFCEAHNLASLNRSPLCTGILTGKFNADSKIPDTDVRFWWNFKEGEQADQVRMTEAVRDILSSDGRTLVQGALCWLWAKSPATIPIPGFKSVKQVTENAGALQCEPLSADQMAEIEQIKRGHLK